MTDLFADWLTAEQTSCYHHMTDWLFVLPPHDIAKHQKIQQTMQPQELLAWHLLLCLKPAKTSMRRFVFLSRLLNWFPPACVGGWRGRGDVQANDAECPHQHLQQACKQQWWAGIYTSVIATVIHSICQVHMSEEKSRGRPCMIVTVAPVLSITGKVIVSIQPGCRVHW